MIGVYVGTALFGSIVIGVSLLFGGHDDGDGGGADHDLDHDHDHDHDHLALPKLDIAKDAPDTQAVWMPLLSLRFWTFFAAVFGITGTLLTLLGFGEPLPALISLPFGLALGYASAMFFQRLRSDQVTADVGLAKYAGLEARVMLPIRPGDIGKIAVSTLAGRVEMPAKSRDGKVLEPGTTVLIASVDGGTADVTSLSPGAARPEGQREGP